MTDIQTVLPSLRTIEKIVLEDKLLIAFLKLHKLDFISTLCGYNISVEYGQLTFYKNDIVFYFKLSDCLILDGFKCGMHNIRRDYFTDIYVIDVATYNTAVTPKCVPDNIADIDGFIMDAIVPKVLSAYEIVYNQKCC